MCKWYVEVDKVIRITPIVITIRSLVKKYDACKYGPINIKWRHAEHEQFGPLQDWTRWSVGQIFVLIFSWVVMVIYRFIPTTPLRYNMHFVVSNKKHVEIWQLLWLILLIWTNFNPGRDKWLLTQESLVWNYFLRCRWCLGIEVSPHTLLVISLFINAAI